MKSRQLSQNANHSNTSQTNHQQQQQNAPSLKNSTKKSSSVYQNAVMSQNATPKQSKKVNTAAGMNKQQSHIQQHQALTKKFSNLHFKENEVFYQFQPSGLFDQRKNSLDYQIQSKSTKVSPQRLSNAPNAVQNQHQNQKAMRQFNEGITNNPAAKNNNGSQVSSFELFQKDHQQQLNLRIPQSEQEKKVKAKNTHSFQNNSEIEGISPNIISHTHVVAANTNTGISGLQKKDIGGGILSGGNSISNHDKIDSSNYQSFINLIYPSKTKKMMGNEIQNLTHKQHLGKFNNGSMSSKNSNHGQASQGYTQNGNSHHQKSKSLFIGANSQNLGVKTNSQQMNNKGIQKVQQSSYKKQANIFNYSNRLKELLNDNISNDDGSCQDHHGGKQYKNADQKHHIFSQQHSPSQSKSNLMVNLQDMYIQRSIERDQYQKLGQNLKNTFDQLFQNPQYLTITDQIAHQHYKGINSTLDCNLNRPNINSFVKGGVNCTPNNNESSTINFKPKLESQPSKTHLRKPSHPVNNNYILEANTQYQQNLNEPSSVRPVQKRDSSKQNSNDHKQGSNEQKQLQNNLQQQIQFQHQLYQPVREKKQHQPTQSKIIQNNKPQINFHHQRSSSDYINYQFSQQQLLSGNDQSNKFKNFLNSDSYDLTAELDYQFENQESSITPAARDTDRGTSFLQQYSQTIQDSNIYNRQNCASGSQISTVIPTVNLNDASLKLGNLGGQQNNPATSGGINMTGSIYHQRKMSYQPPINTIMNKKKSPPQSQFIFKEHYQKLAQKRKSPKITATTDTLSAKPNPGGVSSQSKATLQKQKSIGNSLRSSQVVSPVSNQNQQINNTQQYQYLQNSMNQSQLFSAKQAGNQTAVNHSGSAVALSIHQQKSNQDFKNHIISQATKKYQNQMAQQTKCFTSKYHQNSMVQSSASFHQQNPQNSLEPRSQKHSAAKLKQQDSINISEKVSPRHAGDNKHPHSKKSIANVSIDLYKGLVLMNNQTLQPQPQQQSLPMPRQSSSKIIINKHQKNNSISNGDGNSQSLQGSFIQRKNSYVNQANHHQLSSSRHSSPHTIVKVHNQSSATLIPPQSQPIIQEFNVNQKQLKASQLQQIQRYSVQNSPHKQQNLFHKNQMHLQSSQHMKTNSSSMIQFNAPSQFQLFQQQATKSNNQSVLSPSEKSSGFNKINISSNLRSSAANCTDDSIVMSGGAANYHKRGQGLANQNIVINEFNNKKPQHNFQEDFSPHYQQQQYQSQELTETEYLLNQIRNSIALQKGYKISEVGVPVQQPKEVQQFKNPKNSVNPNLQKITEASVEQFPVETVVEMNVTLKKDKNVNKRELMLNINLPIEDSLSMNYLQTDPNLSPFSKDLSKLKRMIKFNFNKFNEPPATTSEFYRIGRVLGRGAFGKVNLAAHKLSEQLVAIKSINKEFLKSEDDQRKKIMQEFAILKQNTHKSVVRLFDTFETSKHICFVMELCSGGDLLTYVRKRRKLKEDVAKYFFKQIIEGLAYIHHSKLIVHRDIKLDNILLDANGRIKICDFGVSRQVSSEHERMTEQCGTPAYIAPEILKDKGYEGFKVDVWSAGVCLYAMLIGTVPFKASSMHELHHMIINGKYELKDTKLSEHALNLIQQILQVDPKKRLSAYEVLGHPWLKDAQDEMDIFTQKEKDTIRKEYLSKNIDRVQRNSQVQVTNQDTEVIFTEHNLDTRTNGNSLLKNASTKSIILAPFNSTVSGFDEEEKNGKNEWPEEIKKMMVPKKVLKFNPKCKDLDRQYEQNNNADLDNGVYNNFMNDQEDEDNVDKSQKNSNNSRSSSQDSLKRSFKETELSSDDEKAEIQVEEARKQKLQQQSELQEFENQLKLKYVKYQEPVEIINHEIVDSIVINGLFPREYLIKCLNNKDINYATATYHLTMKKQQIMQKLNNENALEQLVD